MPPEEVVKAYVIAREISGMRDLWAEIEALDNKVPAQLQARMLVECGRLVERETVWFLREVGMPLDIAEVIGRFGRGVGPLAARLESFLSPADCELLEPPPAKLVSECSPHGL